jgi:hypothetical protein
MAVAPFFFSSSALVETMRVGQAGQSSGSRSAAVAPHLPPPRRGSPRLEESARGRESNPLASGESEKREKRERDGPELLTEVLLDVVVVPVVLPEVRRRRRRRL